MMEIENVTQALLAQDQVDLNEQHLFADGLYCRTVTMPKGSLVIGHKHRKTAINILSSGVIWIKTRMEDEWEEIRAPFINSTGDGMRKIIYVVEDATFSNIFKTDETDLDSLYDECVYPEEGTKPYLEAEAVRRQIESEVI